MLKRPTAVAAAIALHVLWIIAALVGAVIDSSAGQSKWALMAAVAILYSGVALWTLLARWQWAWALNAVYFGGMALISATALARIPADRLWKYWPFMVILALYAGIAAAMVSSSVRRYFGRNTAGGENAAA